jgi:AcrR family transcriptional regulator
MTERPYHHGNLKSELIRAGIALIEEHGLPALSLRAIAARAGVSHAAPRNHFRNLRDLLTAIAAEAFRMHAAAMRTGLPPDATREARLAAAMEGYCRFAREHPALFALMFSPRDCDMSDPELLTAGAASYAILSDIARDLAWDKSGLPDAQQRTETMLWSFVHGHAHLAATGLLGGPDGQPRYSIADIMPAFGYGPPDA